MGLFHIAEEGLQAGSICSAFCQWLVFHNLLYRVNVWGGGGGFLFLSFVLNLFFIVAGEIGWDLKVNFAVKRSKEGETKPSKVSSIYVTLIIDSEGPLCIIICSILMMK